MKKLKKPEFWITVLCSISGLVIAFGLADHWIVQAISIAVTVLGVSVYNYCQYKIDCKEMEEATIAVCDLERFLDEIEECYYSDNGKGLDNEQDN